MKRIAKLACAIALCLASHAASAQHRGNRGAGAAGAPIGTPANDDLKQFDLAVVLQASPEQAHQFGEWTKDTTLARSKAHELLERSRKAGQADSTPNPDPVSDAVDDLQIDQERFLSGFTTAQKSGMKDLIKKAGKVNSEITRQMKALRASGHSTEIAGVIERLDRALSELQSHQLAMASEMGIKSGESSN
jgi:hypothetical protein